VHALPVLFGTWSVDQFNYSCDADSTGQRMVGHRPVDFNTVSFTNWDNNFMVWTTNWAIMRGVLFTNGTFYASGTVGVNVNDTSASACALTSRISGDYNASEGSWEASLSLDYSSLCWGCLLDEDNDPYTETLPLHSSHYLSAPIPSNQPSSVPVPLYLEDLMSNWPVSVRRKCGLLNLQLTAIEFSSVNFSLITISATTTLGKLVLRGKYDVSNNNFSASISFPFNLGPSASCIALVQVAGQVHFYDNSTCAEEHNATLSWDASVSMLVFGACANCSQLVFPISSEPLSDCQTPFTNSPTKVSTSNPSSRSPTHASPSILDSSWSSFEGEPDDDSFIPGIPLWASIVIVVVAFLCCLVMCACLLCPRRQTPNNTVVAEQEKLVTA